MVSLISTFSSGVVFSFSLVEGVSMNENPNYESEELIEWVFLDEHDGADWKYEPVLQSS